MTCHEFADLLIDFVGDDLPPAVQEAIRQHVCRCPPCGINLQTYQLTIHISRRLPRAEVPAHLLARVRAALDESPGGEQA